MILKDHIGYSLQVSLTWIEPNEIKLTFKQYRTLEEINEINYYLKPNELEKLNDYINDILCH